MNSHKKLRLSCPSCDAELVVDATTGQLLSHTKPAEPLAGGATMESLMQEMEAGKSRAEDLFEQEKVALKDSDRLMEERFREALERVSEADEEEAPLRPFDLD